ncbi:MAG TPA: hypothetical protein VFW83_05915 [Bryobacteraceae bacterium]|nr:hypothetical protein [Bryobacteraceae bacterium]
MAVAVNHAPEFTDTDPRAMEVWLELMRTMPPGQKLAAALNGAGFLLQMYEMGVRRRYPNASDREVLRRVAARHLPAELVTLVYGGNSDSDGDAG